MERIGPTRAETYFVWLKFKRSVLGLQHNFEAQDGRMLRAKLYIDQSKTIGIRYAEQHLVHSKWNRGRRDNGNFDHSVE